MLTLTRSRLPAPDLLVSLLHALPLALSLTAFDAVDEPDRLADDVFEAADDPELFDEDEHEDDDEPTAPRGFMMTRG